LWLASHRGLKKAPPGAVRLEAGREVVNTARGLVLPVTITNRSPAAITTTLTHEWHGGLWPSTDLYASVAPAGAPKLRPFHAAYLIGERPGGSRRKVTVPAGQSVTVEVRMDWPGTGSCPAEPLMSPSAQGAYEVRLLLVFEGGRRRYAVGGPARVRLKAR
jgi:hypothetical protein